MGFSQFWTLQKSKIGAPAQCSAGGVGESGGGGLFWATDCRLLVPSHGGR